jgi:hypothetical protein
MLGRHIPAKHIPLVTEVVGSDEFAEWFDSPFRTAARSRARALHCANCAFSPAATPLRVLYAFDPVRRAVLLLGGDKTGDKRFYERLVPLAEQIFAQYLKEIAR